MTNKHLQELKEQLADTFGENETFNELKNLTFTSNFIGIKPCQITVGQDI